MAGPKLKQAEQGCSACGLFEKVIRIGLEQVPTKLHDFVDKDLLQTIKLARFLFGEAIPLRREAR
jgi:hypothetical protein